MKRSSGLEDVALVGALATFTNQMVQPVFTVISSFVPDKASLAPSAAVDGSSGFGSTFSSRCTNRVRAFALGDAIFVTVC